MRYLLAIISITEIIIKNQRSNARKTDINNKSETYLLLYLMHFIGRRVSSPAAAHDCDLYFLKKRIIRRKKVCIGSDLLTFSATSKHAGTTVKLKSTFFIKVL